MIYPWPNYFIEAREWMSNFTPLYWAGDYLSMLGLKLVYDSKWGARPSKSKSLYNTSENLLGNALVAISNATH